jgi:hypothetical protein
MTRSTGWGDHEPSAGGCPHREWEIELGGKGAMTTKTNRAIKTPAERMRSYRRRQRHKWQAVRIEIAAAEVDALVKRGYLEPKNRDDQTAIEEAATAFISDALYEMSRST